MMRFYLLSYLIAAAAAAATAVKPMIACKDDCVRATSVRASIELGTVTWRK